ncbi:hypothetical protein [Novosphingobium kaempferiae]|uniref:hypothetical protein n=1 Tax=Novosphingobium kaempferiae TaxID=2896849 RepID=UPI001E64EC8E|nr:hypothetical protein [Novosphingobium kaempferiae]
MTGKYGADFMHRPANPWGTRATAAECCAAFRESLRFGLSKNAHGFRVVHFSCVDGRRGIEIHQLALQIA